MGSNSGPMPLHFLLVEDNPGDVALWREALAETGADVQLSTARDGVEALAALTQERPDLVLLDLNLPRLDGHGVLSAIREHPDLCWLPVLILSSSQDPAEIDAAYAAHANGYLAKPAEWDGLVALARRAVGYWAGVAELPMVA
jgi:two-component system, chemotaxis family, response regulator Rcp1